MSAFGITAENPGYAAMRDEFLDMNPTGQVPVMVDTARKVVLEFLGSSVDVSLAGPATPDGTVHAVLGRYRADPPRRGPPSRSRVAR